MALARQKCVFVCAFCADDGQHFTFEHVDTRARQRRKPNVALRKFGANSRFDVRIDSGEIAFVVNHNARKRRGQPCDHRCVRRIERINAIARVNDQHGKITAFDRSACAFDANFFDFIIRVVQSSGIDDGQRNPGQLDAPFDGVARGAGDRRYDRRLFTCKPVEQTGFADIRPADQHDVQPFAQQRAGSSARVQTRQIAANHLDAANGVMRAQESDILFGEVERRLGVHPEFSDRRDNCMDVARELAAQTFHRRARGGGGRGIDQIGNSLRLRKIKLAVQKCAFGKFTRLGDSRAEVDTTRKQQA